MAIILVVEDNDDLRSLYERALRGRGHEISLAANGQIALDLLRTSETKPSLIILDLMMPVMDGWEFLKHRAQNPELAAVPVVVCSASREDIPEGVTFLRKPINLAQLSDIVKFATQGHTPPGASETE